MAVAERTWGAFKSFVLYQETIKAIRDDMAALSRDVAALSNAHADLRDRISRLEGVIDGVAMAGRQRRIEG
ncbi:hypothetical protein [Sphingomonas bacterium]|uniref:hypothetical protein n=1 Tax=Sphingomonas bacterium TaxID=1895847 RepID=UPI001575C612|nr:hypothetical protein [Sphingomonas bacterium]